MAYQHEHYNNFVFHCGVPLEIPGASADDGYVEAEERDMNSVMLSNVTWWI